MVYSSTMNCNETTEFSWNATDNANGVCLYQISTEKGMIQGRVVKEEFELLNRRYLKERLGG